MKTTTSIKIKKLEEIASPLGQLRGSRRERFGYALNKVKEIMLWWIWFK